MARHFLSVLGTGNYRLTTYRLKEKQSKTMYVQEALLDLIFEGLREDDKISIFVTDEARNKNWTPENGEGLYRILNEKASICECEPIKIPKGSNDEQLMEMFEIIYDRISENDEVYFDITHGLRNIPMFALTILSYARVLKNIKIGGIYYGAYEVRENDISPVFDMTAYMSILDWTTSAELMIKYGNANMMQDTYSEHKNLADIEMQKQLGSFETPIKFITYFTNCIQTSRGKTISGNSKSEGKKEQRSISDAYKGFLRNYRVASENKAYMIEPLKPLFEKVIESTKQFDTESNLETGLATIQWCIDKGFIQQGLTALDETIKTYICNMFQLDENSKFYRDDVSKFALNLNKWTKENRDKTEEIKKKYKSIDIKNKELMNEDEYVKLVEKVHSSIDKRLFNISKEVSDARNDINHFGFSNSSEPYDKLQKKLEKRYVEFINIITEKKLEQKSTLLGANC